MMLGIAVILFVCVMLLAVGFWASRKVKTSEDYFVGGRGIGALVTIGTQWRHLCGRRYDLGLDWNGLPIRPGGSLVRCSAGSGIFLHGGSAGKINESKRRGLCLAS